MQIEKLNENKIKITLNLHDLSEKNIDIHSFMSTSIESQDLFYDVLDKAEKILGFKTKNYKLIAEILAIPEGNFILTITRILPKKDNLEQIDIKKNILQKNNLSIYAFNSFDDYLNCCNYIKKHSNKNTYIKLKKSCLYQYNSIYYLCINTTNMNLDSIKAINCLVVEFSTYVSNSDLFEKKLIEYGNLIFKTNAINECIKTFG